MTDYMKNLLINLWLIYYHNLTWREFSVSSNLKIFLEDFAQTPRKWLVTGAAGFIGSHLVETLLNSGQTVVGLDNFSTGKREKLSAIADLVGSANWQRFNLIEGDIRDPETCLGACRDIDIVLHQAALVSVPQSLNSPVETASINVLGFANILAAAHNCGVRRVVYASSSAVYGAASGMSNLEEEIGQPLSPYALSKLENEQHASMYSRLFGLSTVGLRYFNVYGKRQTADGGYAAVIPLWVAAGLEGGNCRIFGDGSATRDFCYIGDVVQANLRAATAEVGGWDGSSFNVGTGRPVTMSELHSVLGVVLQECQPGIGWPEPEYGITRPGDILHSCASIERALTVIQFRAEYSLKDGLKTLVLPSN